MYLAGQTVVTERRTRVLLEYLQLSWESNPAKRALSIEHRAKWLFRIREEGLGANVVHFTEFAGTISYRVCTNGLCTMMIGFGDFYLYSLIFWFYPHQFYALDLKHVFLCSDSSCSSLIKSSKTIISLLTRAARVWHPTRILAMISVAFQWRATKDMKGYRDWVKSEGGVNVPVPSSNWPVTNHQTRMKRQMKIQLILKSPQLKSASRTSLQITYQA